VTASTKYDPFARGPFPVGVQTQSWNDEVRGRTLTVEIWYPCTDDYRGLDVDPATMDWFEPGWATDGESTPERYAPQQAVRDAERRTMEQPAPLVLLIHGWAGFRRESTFVGSHLASHGYVVVSPDVVGTTFAEVNAFLAQQEPLGDPEDLLRHARDNAEVRVGDVSFLIAQSMSRLPVRDERVGVTGASFGGYSSLVSPTADPRVAAIAAMCPANDDSPIVKGSEVFNDLILAPWLSYRPAAGWSYRWLTLTTTTSWTISSSVRRGWANSSAALRRSSRTLQATGRSSRCRCSPWRDLFPAK